MCLARTWRYPRKIFSNFYSRAAPLIVKLCLRSWFKHPRELIPEWQWCLLRPFFTSRVSVEHEEHVLSLPMLMSQSVGHHHASDVNAVIRLVWDAPRLDWNVSESRRLQWGEEWNKRSQDGQFWALIVERIPTKADIALFTLICCAADKHDIISLLLLLY